MNVIKTEAVNKRLLTKFLINIDDLNIYTFYNNLYKIINSINNIDLENLLKFSLLDEYYYFILKKKNELSLILINKEFNNIYISLESHLNYIIKFYRNIWLNNYYITNNEPENYNIFIILGHKNEFVCKKRVDGMIVELLKTKNKPILVFSGKDECQKMYDYFLTKYKKYENDIILENYSLDTVGNAIFSKLEIIKYSKDKGINFNKFKIGLFSSSYHCIRSYHLFKKVFLNTDIITSFFIYKKEEVDKEMLNNELKNDYISGNQIFSFEENYIFNSFLKTSFIEINDGDIKSFLLNLIINHGLYKGKKEYYELYEIYLS